MRERCRCCIGCVRWTKEGREGEGRRRERERGRREKRPEGNKFRLLPDLLAAATALGEAGSQYNASKYGHNFNIASVIDKQYVTYLEIHVRIFEQHGIFSSEYAQYVAEHWFRSGRDRAFSCPAIKAGSNKP